MGLVLDKLGQQISRVVLCFVTICYRFGMFMMFRFFSCFCWMTKF